MREKIVSLRVAPRAEPKPAPAEVWHGQINARLSGIERLMRRLEWQVWGLVCGATGLLVLEVLNRLASQ
ncbi:hypothetical protein ACOI1H_09230 [Loktanella sp. DJP18]|uniref:hypothetical protein n=1 Tax=Loktanella sp. DJP18 TaxID=3409788 RepID=UPI003BB5FFDB